MGEVNLVKVSVIIPFYNVEHYINECIDSVINQTLTDIEIICIDDGSNDNSLNLVKEYSDSRIKIITQKNKGLSVSRNVGMEHATGEYITFLDSDDYLRLDALEKLYNVCKENSLDIVLTKIINFYDDNREEYNEDYFDMKFLKDACGDNVFNYKDVYDTVLNISVTGPSKLYRRDFIKNIRFHENLIFEDNPFFIEAIFKAERVYFYDEYIYWRRIRRDSITNSNFSSFPDLIEIYNIIYDLLKDLGVYEDFKDKIFKKKFTNIYTRFIEVTDEYKQDFFDKIQVDFPKSLKNLEKDKDFDKFNPRAKFILYAGINSDTYQEFESSVKEYDSRKKEKKLKKERSRTLGIKDFGNDKRFKFSVIMAVYNCENYLDKTINSIINQTLDFKKNIQLILVNDGSSDNSEKIAFKYQKRFPNNIIVLSKENGGVSSARNLGLKYATGDYINFMDSDDLIFDDTFKKVNNFFSRHKSDDYDVVVIPVNFFGVWNREHFLNYKFEESKSDFIDLNKHPDFFQCFTHSSFIKKDAIKDLEFDTELIHFEDAVFINKIIMEKMKYGIVKDTSYLYRKEYNSSAITSNSVFRKEYYTNRFKYGHLELIKYSLKKFGEVFKFIQNIIIYDLRWLVEIQDFHERLEEIFDNPKELDEFYMCFDEVLSYLDIDLIRNHKVIPSHVKSFLIYLKNKDFHVVSRPKRNKVFLKSNDLILNKIHNHKIHLDIVDLKKGFLNISGSFVSLCDLDFIRIEAEKIINGKKIIYEAEYYDYKETYRTTIKLCSIPWKFYYNFDIKIPIHDDEVSKVSLNVIHEENGIVTSFRGKLKFRQYADITEQSYYTVRDNKILSCMDNFLFIEDYSTSKILKKEAKTILNIIKDHRGYFLNAVLYRLTYSFLFVLMKNKNIWILMDRPNQSGDNAEHLFHHIIKQNDGIDKYFMIEKDSIDYKRLKKQYNNKIVKYGSIKHKLLHLFAKKVVSSHPDELYLEPFRLFNPKYYRGLITSEIYFLQHGVPKYAMPNWLRKYDHNLSLITAVSEVDYKSYLKCYNFDEEIIQILGYPRFDNLTNENMKKQIVIIFSWRNFINNEHILLDSEYYERLNSLINNEKLINHAKEKGYEIIFKLHPRLVEYIEFFDKNEYVTFDEVTRYHDLICDSALMVTDYSSVAFDFAYLKKPVIYYQYGDDYHFDVETSFFDEEKYGFGDIFDDEEELVDKIIYYMDNDCTSEDKFKNHVDAFYKFNDKNNSKRCYEWIKSH